MQALSTWGGVMIYTRPALRDKPPTRHKRKDLTQSEREAIASDMVTPTAELAKKYRCSQSTISVYRRIMGKPADRRGRKKLSHETVLAIFEDPRSHRKIAIEHGVARSTVSLIKRGAMYSEITGKMTRCKA